LVKLEVQGRLKNSENLEEIISQMNWKGKDLEKPRPSYIFWYRLHPNL